MGHGLAWRIVLPYSLLFAVLTGGSGWYAARRAAAISEQRLMDRMSRVTTQLSALPLNRQQELERIKGVIDMEVGVGLVTGQVHHTLGAEAAAPLRALITGPAGRGRATLDGRDYRYVRRPVQGPFLSSLTVLVPEDRVDEVRAEAARGILAAAAASVLLAILLGSWLARSLTRPIAELARQTRRLAGGELERPLEPSGPGELRALAESFNQMAESLARSRAELVEAEKRALLGRMAAAVAHEIRNPLTPIRMTVQLLAERVDDQARADLQVVLGEIDRLESVVGELLTLGKPGEPELRPIDLREPVSEILRLVAGRFAHRRITLERQLGDRPVEVQADPDRVKQALMNLVLNALDATRAEGEVTVRIERSAAGVGIAVEDQGGGVAEPERLFTPFYTTKPEGTGIGLVLARTIAEGHGGSLRHESIEGGARFVLTLPIAP